ncbi:MAG: RNA polymerase sigma factor [Verrucomicrobiales bacterium]
MTEEEQCCGEGGLPVGRLTELMAKGDEAAWTEFHERYFYRMLGYLLALHGGDEMQARESIQKTYLRVVRHVRRFDVEAVFWSWLTKLVRCVVIDESRRVRRYSGLMEKLARTVELESAQPVEPGMVAVVLEDCLARWRADDRQIIERKYFEQWSYSDLAEELSLTPKAVESRLARLRARLKDCIVERLRHV